MNLINKNAIFKKENKEINRKRKIKLNRGIKKNLLFFLSIDLFIPLYMSVFDIFHGGLLGLLVTPFSPPPPILHKKNWKLLFLICGIIIKNLIKTYPPPPTPQSLPFYIYTCRLLGPFTLGVKKYLLKEPVGYLFYFLFLPIPLQIVII